MVDAKKQLNQEASREEVIESVRSSVISAVSRSNESDIVNLDGINQADFANLLGSILGN